MSSIYRRRPLVEYVYNSSTSTTNDTTSFASGSGGALVQSFAPSGITVVTKRVRFNTPILATDEVKLQFQIQGDTFWTDVGNTSFVFGSNDAGTTAYGARVFRVGAGSTDVDVFFQSAANPASAWSSFTTSRWRVVKISY